MPITDHEKELRLHSRPSSDFLAAVPIKKRRFMFPQSPSPPPELPFPVLADCGVSENKQESSEAGPCSKAGGNSVQGSVVTSEVTTCESHDPPSVTSSDCGICEKKSDSSELGHKFSKTRGNPAQLNIVMGKVVSFESHESSSSALADCHITEKEPSSSESATPFSTSGCNLVQVNSLPGEHASCEPCDLPSPTPSGCDTSEKKPECSEEPESPFLSTRGNPAQVNSVAGKHVSGESCEVRRSRDLNICPTHEILPRFNNQGSGSNLAANFMDVTGNVQGMVLNNECAIWPSIGGASIPSATKQTFETPGREGSFNGRFSLSEGISVKQEDVGLQNIQSIVSDAKHKADSSHLCLNRSNWDLNTTMDAWEGSSADSLPNSGSADNCLRDAGGVQNTSLELGLKQNVLYKLRETDELLRNYNLQKNLKFPNMSASMIDSNSKTCLDLQLKPSFLSNSCNTSGKNDSISELPLLSLGTQPVLATSLPPLSLGGTVKSEPIERDQNDTRKVLKQVKSEPGEEKEISKTTISANMNLACSRALKTGPLEEQSQGYALEGSSFHIGQKSHTLLPLNNPMDQNAGDNDSKNLDVASERLDLNSVLHGCTSRCNINTFNNSSDMLDKVPNLVNLVPIPKNDISPSTATIQDPIEIHMVHSVLVLKSHISDGDDTNSFPEACETSSLPRASLPEYLTNNGEGNDNSEAASELLVQMEPSNFHPSSNVTLTDVVIQNPCGNTKVVESVEVEGKVGAEEPCESTIDTIHKCCAQDDEDYKDDEMRYPVLNDTVEGSPSVKAADSICPVDVPVSIQFVADSSKEANALSPKENDGDLNESKVEPSSLSIGALTAESDRRSVRKIIRSTLKDHPEEDKGLEKKSKLLLNDTVEGSPSVKAADSISPVDVPVSILFVGDSSKEANALSPKENDGGLNESKVEPSYLSIGALTTESNKRIVSKIIPSTLKDHPEEDKGLEKKSKSNDLVTKTSLSDNHKPNAEGPSLAKSYYSCKIDPLEKEGVTKGANDRCNNRQIIYLNSARNCLAVGNKKSTLDRSISSRGARERPFNRIFRDESVNERSRKSENERHYSHQIENSRTDLMPPIRSRADRNANHDHILEQRNNSAGTRYSPEFSNRQTRKLKNEEMQNLSRLPFQRRSPQSRLQIPFGHHPIEGRDASPRCIRRDVPDFAFLGHQDTQYERDEGVNLRRERRIMSPPLRRGGALHLPPNCSRSLQQQRTTHQWSPPRRSSDGFNGPQEFVRSRSPQIMRLHKMRSPHEEMIVRRRGSLNYDIVDVGPSREQDFPRLVRGSNRNTRRFDMIDPREIAADEYFDPCVVDNRIQEFGVDEFVEDRGCNERRHPIRESFRFHDEDGPNPRALGFNPDVNEGRGPRDFDARFRNRLGNSSGRFRGSVEDQEGNYRLDEEQEWCDATYNDTRTKRRQF